MTYKTADGKIILSQQEHINIGQAKNQATTILSQVWTKIMPFDREENYKRLVKNIYQWNTELDSEIMETGKEQQQPSSKATTPFEPQQQSQSPSNYPKHDIKKFGGRI